MHKSHSSLSCSVEMEHSESGQMNGSMNGSMSNIASMATLSMQAETPKQGQPSPDIGHAAASTYSIDQSSIENGSPNILSQSSNLLSQTTKKLNQIETTYSSNGQITNNYLLDSSLKRDISMHDTRCKCCGKVVAKRSIGNHMHRCTVEQIECPDCHLVLSMSELGVHIWQQHFHRDLTGRFDNRVPIDRCLWDSVPYKCQLCNFQCAEMNQFHPHYASNHRFPYCPLCLEPFIKDINSISHAKLIENIKDHLRVHLAVKRCNGNDDVVFACSRCQLHFLTPFKLTIHLEQDHANDQRLAPQNNGYFYNMPRRCPHVLDSGVRCSYTTTCMILYQMHIDAHKWEVPMPKIRITRNLAQIVPLPIRQQGTKMEVDPNPVFICTTCGVRATSSIQLARHLNANKDHIGFTSAD